MKKFSKFTVGALAASAALGIAGLVLAAAAVSLGNADNFAVLGASGITFTTPSVVVGDVGLSPSAGTLYTGVTTGQVTGTIYAVDGTGPVGSVNNPALLTAAQGSLTTAYGVAAGYAPTTLVSANLGGQTLTPGVYKDNGAPASLAITGTLTLDGQGDPNAVFVFQSASTLTTASASTVTLINGAQACNIFWQVGSSATLGTGSSFKGNILAFSSITDNGGSTVEGRLLARNAAVTLNNTHVTKATCVAPPPAPVSINTGGSSFAILPLLDLTKIPSPLALPAGPGTVKYTYVAKNIGTVPMIGAWVKDDKCAPLNYVSGDTNSNNILDVGESWTYTCTKTVSKTETNTATAHGQSNGWDVYRTANATIVVGASIVPPLIHVVKTPSTFLLPAGGGPVTYSYSVTNPGIASLHDVSITDDKCTGLPGRVIGHPGDVNKNGLLDPGEVWQFTCQSNLTQTTTNIGTAQGHANGLTALDFAPATVVVTSPGLPNTGFPPETTRTIAIAVAAIILAVAIGLAIKRRTA